MKIRSADLVALDAKSTPEQRAQAKRVVDHWLDVRSRLLKARERVTELEAEMAQADHQLTIPIP